MKNKGISIMNSNALITKINANDMFEKLMITTQNSKSQASLYTTEVLKTRPKTMFNSKRIHNKLKHFENNQANTIEDLKMITCEPCNPEQTKYLTLLNKRKQKESQHNFVKIEKLKKNSKLLMPKSSHQKIRTCRKENIKLETIINKLVLSYAQLKPQVANPLKQCEKGKRSPSKPMIVKPKSTNILLFPENYDEDHSLNLKL